MNCDLYTILIGVTIMRRSNQVVSIYGTVERESQPNVTVSDIAEQYLETLRRKQVSEYTHKHEREGLNVMLKMIGDLPLQLISTDMLEERVFDVMRQRGNKGITINGRIKILDRVFKFAVDREIIHRNPVTKVARMRDVQQPVASLRQEQLMDLVNAPNLNTFTGLRDQVMIALAADTGLRLRELLDINADQVDIKHRQINNVVGKNGKSNHVPFSNILAKMLKVYITERASSMETTPALFMTVNGTRMSRKNFQERMKMYGYQVQITDVRVSPHTLRHTFARNWVVNGGNAFGLKRALRHSTMEMTNRYVNLWDPEVAEMQAKYSPLRNCQMVRNHIRLSGDPKESTLKRTPTLQINWS